MTSVQNSPLHSRLPVSSVIYRLDDLYLDNNIKDWNEFLLESTGRHKQPFGFCIGLKKFSGKYQLLFTKKIIAVVDPKLTLTIAIFTGNNLDCCQIDENRPFGRSKDTSLSCFERFSQQPPVSRCGERFGRFSSLRSERYI